MLESFFIWLVDTIRQLGYPGLILMMAMESSFIPLPSELVLPPAGYLVFQGKMDMWLVILCGVIGSILGALFNYWLGARFGRKFLLKYGKYILLPEEKYYKTEKFFQEHGEISTFVGRLLFGVRHFISFPAGVARMKMGPFLFYTAVGSAIWSTILTVLGYYVGEQQELLHLYYREIGIGLLVFCVLLIGIYVWWHKKMKNRKSTAL